MSKEHDFILSTAKPYIDTAKIGDVITIGPCTNPANWWTVYRNDRPIHHFAYKDYAEGLQKAIQEAS